MDSVSVDLLDALRLADLGRVVWAVGAVVADTYFAAEQQGLLQDDRLQAVLREVQHWCCGDGDAKELEAALLRAFGPEKNRISRWLSGHLPRVPGKANPVGILGMNVRDLGEGVLTAMTDRLPERSFPGSLRIDLGRSQQVWAALGEDPTAAFVRVQRTFRHALETP